MFDLRGHLRSALAERYLFLSSFSAVEDALGTIHLTSIGVWEAQA